MLTVNQKIEHLRKLGIDGDMTELEKLYRGEEFNIHSLEYKRLLELSKQYCVRFTELSGLASHAKSQIEIENYAKEKQEILDIIFPDHGPLYGGGDGLFAIIGMVDLDGFNYLNTRVHFNASSLVHLGEYVFVAPNVEFGSNELSATNGKKRLGKISVGRDSWIGANVILDDDTNVGERSVIGMGSHIVANSSLAPDMISFGNPCKEYKKITEDYETVVKKPSIEARRTDVEISRIISHLKKLGIDGDFTQYVKSLNYEKYNTLEPTIAEIFTLSHKLCSEYNRKEISIKRRKEILNALFPLQGDNLIVGNDIFVDCIGTVKIGNDVTIGNNAMLNGNITIGSNVKIGNNVVLQTIGHEINYRGRRLSRDTDGNICEISTPGYIVILPDLTLADGTKVIPNRVVGRNTVKDELITHDRE